MRKHEVQCQIEGDKEHIIGSIQDEINVVYVKLVASVMRKSNLSKEEQLRLIDQIKEKIKKI